MPDFVRWWYKLSHPVIMGKNEDFERVKSLIGKDAFITGLYNRAVLKADEMLEKETVVRYLDEINLDAEYNHQRFDILSFVYSITGEEKYLTSVKKELDAVCALPDWQTFKFLNTAAFGMGVATAYDRIYYAISDEERRKYRSCLKEKLLDPALVAYADEGDDPFRNFGWWSKVDTNWNAVCNGAVIAAASVIYDDEKEYCEGVIEKAINTLKKFIAIFEPHGAFVEGISYWFYANMYMSRGLSALENRLGGAGKLLSGAGFRKNLLYAEVMNHDAYNFNFHDVGTESRIDTSPLMFYARVLDLPELGRSRVRAFKNGFLPIADEVNPSDMLWYIQKYSEGIEDSEPEDIYFPVTEICVLRDKDIAIALHGGDNAAIHGHLDNGTLILDAKGKRWFCDLGKDMLTYSIKGQKYNRWDLYRMRPEGHNCIVINPSEKPGQILDGFAVITSFEKGEISSAEIDLTSSYENAQSIKRTLTLNKKMRTLEIQDDILLKEESIIYSFFHTRAEVNPEGNKATLTMDGEKINISCNYPLCVMPAQPLDTSPVIDEQAENKDAVKLYIKAENEKCAQFKLKINF